MSRVHPEDIIVVGGLHEARAYRQFPQAQVISASMFRRLEGRRFRVAWITEGARHHLNWAEAQAVLDMVARSSIPPGELRHINQWEPEELSLVEQLALLPEQHATSSRDFGRGYSLAIKHAIELIVKAVT